MPTMPIVFVYIVVNAAENHNLHEHICFSLISMPSCLLSHLVVHIVMQFCSHELTHFQWHFQRIYNARDPHDY